CAPRCLASASSHPTVDGLPLRVPSSTPSQFNILLYVTPREDRRRPAEETLFPAGAFLPRSAMKAVPDLPKHPKPLGPYSPAVVANGFVFISGQTPLVPGGKPGEWAANDAGGQTRQCLR